MQYDNGDYKGMVWYALVGEFGSSDDSAKQFVKDYQPMINTCEAMDVDALECATLIYDCEGLD